MKTNKKLFLATIAIVGITWLVVLLLVCGIAKAGGVGTVGFVFGLLSFAAVCVLNMLPEKGTVRNDASAYVIPFAVSVCYLGVSVVINTLLIVLAGFIIDRFPWLTTAAIIINVLLLSAFCMYALNILAYLGGLGQKDAAVRAGTAKVSQLSVMLGGMIASAGDTDIGKALQKLKEAVDFSTNTTAGAGAKSEARFMQQLSEIQNAIKTGADSASVTAMIDNAFRTWQARNAATN